MHITYLIGNGFDLALGLKTGYLHFLSNYTLVPEGAHWVSRYAAQLRERISRNVTDWADAEIAFARLDFSSMFPEQEDRDKYLVEMVEEFQSALNGYLKAEASRFKIENITDSDVFLFRMRIVSSVIEGLRGIASNSYLLNELGKAPSTIDAINLNYTTTFDRLFYGAGSSIEIPFDCQIGNRDAFKFNVGMVHHVHGTLKEGNTLFGVSAPEQINDPFARRVSETSGLLIKSNMDKENGRFAYNPALDSISQSDVVIVFGVSFGGSDKLWWKALVDKVMSDSRFRIYIFPYMRNPTSINTTAEVRQLQSRWRQQLISSIENELSTDEKRRLIDNMYKIVVLNYGPYDRVRVEANGFGDPFSLRQFAERIVERG